MPVVSFPWDAPLVVIRREAVRRARWDKAARAWSMTAAEAAAFLQVDQSCSELGLTALQMDRHHDRSMEGGMASAQQLKEWATGCMKQSTVSVSQITANSYRRLAQKLHELSASRVANDTQGSPRRKDPSPSSDE
jgi:hypothetical protein